MFGPDSAALALKTLFAPASAAGLDATFELRLGDQWFSARVSDGRFEITRGEPDRADATIKTDPSTLAGVLWHGRSIRQAVRTGELEIARRSSPSRRVPPAVPAAGGVQGRNRRGPGSSEITNRNGVLR